METILTFRSRSWRTIDLKGSLNHPKKGHKELAGRKDWCLLCLTLKEIVDFAAARNRRRFVRFNCSASHLVGAEKDFLEKEVWQTSQLNSSARSQELHGRVSQAAHSGHRRWWKHLEALNCRWSSAIPRRLGVPSSSEKSFSRVLSTWSARTLNFTFAALSRYRNTAALPGGELLWPFGKTEIQALMPKQIWNLSLRFSWPIEKLEKSKPDKSQEKDVPVPKGTCFWSSLYVCVKPSISFWSFFLKSSTPFCCSFFKSSFVFCCSAFFLSSSSHLFLKLWASSLSRACASTKSWTFSSPDTWKAKWLRILPAPCGGHWGNAEMPRSHLKKNSAKTTASCRASR